MNMEKYILEAFKQKYGDNTFNQIVEKIKKEIKVSDDSFNIHDDYILYIFEICILEECDIEEEKIKRIIKGMGNKYTPPIDISELQKIHRDSIKLIKGYLKNSI